MRLFDKGCIPGHFMSLVGFNVPATPKTGDHYPTREVVIADLHGPSPESFEPQRKGPTDFNLVSQFSIMIRSTVLTVCVFRSVLTESPRAF